MTSWCPTHLKNHSKYILRSLFNYMHSYMLNLCSFLFISTSTFMVNILTHFGNHKEINNLNWTDISGVNSQKINITIVLIWFTLCLFYHGVYTSENWYSVTETLPIISRFYFWHIPYPLLEFSWKQLTHCMIFIIRMRYVLNYSSFITW